LGNDTLYPVSQLRSPLLDPYKDNGIYFHPGKGSDTVYGGFSDDILIGGEGNDKLIGELYETASARGNDTLSGGEGDDTLDGSQGKRDTAIFRDRYENFKYSISGDTITFNHIKGTQIEGKDTLKNIEYAIFDDAYGSRTIVSLPSKDGPEDTNETSILNNNGDTIYASLGSSIYMYDRDADYKINLSSSQQNLQYNFAYIIDVSGSMNGNPLQEAKSAYTSLTNSLINSGIADVSQFKVIPFDSNVKSVSPSGLLDATQAVTAIQNAYGGGGTNFTPALNTAHQFFSGLPDGGTLIGGADSDTYIVDSLDDVIIENESEGSGDEVEASINYSLENLAHVEDLMLTGNALNGTGNSLDNRVYGNDLNNTLSGNEGRDKLRGYSGNDSLIGGSDRDTLDGGAGEDTLIGGMGDDELTGSAGADIFVFNNPNEGIDEITDFSATDDTIHVSAAGFGGGLIAGDIISEDQILIGSSSAADSATQRFIYCKPKSSPSHNGYRVDRSFLDLFYSV
jgi:Ca2+-binding RTX toxin-like protein